MTALRERATGRDQGKGTPLHAPDTEPPTADRAKGLLDLDAARPPNLPRALRQPVMGARVPAHVAAWVREQAHRDGCSINAWLGRLIEAARTGGLPADCHDWLVTQAGQCGCPGDPDQALVAVIRHLADRWPDGARLQ